MFLTGIAILGFLASHDYTPDQLNRSRLSHFFHRQRLRQTSTGDHWFLQVLSSVEVTDFRRFLRHVSVKPQFGRRQCWNDSEMM
jgi:hypothetical protein